MKGYLFLPITVGLITSSVSTEQGQEPPRIHELRRRYLLASDGFYSSLAGRLGIVEGFSAALASNALYLHAGAPIIQGRAEIHDFLRNTYPIPTSLTWRHASGDVSQNGRLGYTWGWTELRVDGGTVHHGKYIAFWKLEHGLWEATPAQRHVSALMATSLQRCDPAPRVSQDSRPATAWAPEVT